MQIQLMRRFCLGIVMVLFAPLAMGQSAAPPVNLAQLMQANHAALDAADAAVAASKFDDARESVAILRKNFMALRGFWSTQGRSDVVRIVGDGLNRFSSIEELLGRPEVNVERVRTALTEFRQDVLSRLPQSSS